MRPSLRGYFIVLACLWALLGVAASLFAVDQNIPFHVARAVVPAFLIEAALYLAAGFESVRVRLEQLRPALLAVLMTAVAPVPWIVYALPGGAWDWGALLAIVALAAAASFWYVLLPRQDLLFLVLLAGVVLLKVFRRLYPEPHPDVELEVLGVAMWVRTGMLAVLSIRHMPGIGFGFWPTAREWRVGMAHFGVFLPFGLVIAWATRFIQPHAPAFAWRTVLLAVGTFFAMLWVVALFEEFFFRGIVQQWLERVFQSQGAGLIAASLLFGAAHLPFRAFPNWRFALLASVAGLFYGHAYQKGRGIRAAMVAHALTNTVWRVLLA